MAKLNWFLRLKNMASTDPAAKDLLDSINNAETDEAKESAKEAAKAYVESISDEPALADIKDETPAPDAEITPETPIVSDNGEMEIETETDEPTGERPEPTPTPSPLAQKIARRQKMTEEAIAKRRNQPITLSEQKKAAIEKGKEVMKRNEERAAQRKALHEMIERQMAERRANDVKNMTGVLSILLRELNLRKRLEIICKENNITRKDLETLRKNNPSGWEQCKAIREVIDVEMDLYIK